MVVLVGLGAGLHGDGQQRLGHRPGHEHEWVGLVRQGVSGFGPAQSADRADVTGDDRRRGALLLSQRERQGADALVLVMVGMAVRRAEEGRKMARHVHGRVGRDGPGEHPDQADPADGSDAVFTTSASNGPSGSQVGCCEMHPVA